MAVDPRQRQARQRQGLEIEYQEVCRSHAAITDFRGKLLALLPIASGTGLFLLLRQPPDWPFLAAIGVFGFAVSLGLFVYELRNIQECKELIRQGRQIEGLFNLPRDVQRFGKKPPARGNGLLGAEGAGWIIYTAIICGWIFVAVEATRIDAWVRLSLPIVFVAILIAKFAPRKATNSQV
jgi:hypothetical protein